MIQLLINFASFYFFIGLLLCLLVIYKLKEYNLDIYDHFGGAWQSFAAILVLIILWPVALFLAVNGITSEEDVQTFIDNIFGDDKK